jgi:hypothetical protein
LALVQFWVLRVILGGLENQRFKGLLWVAYTLALVAYITWLLARFDAFWRHCGGGGLGGLASRENLTIKMRDAHVRVRGRVRVRVRMMCAGACVRIHDPPPSKKRPPLKKERASKFLTHEKLRKTQKVKR